MRVQLALLILLGVVIAGGAGAWQLSRIGIHQGYSPAQPVAFPHKVHAGDNQIVGLVFAFVTGVVGPCDF